MRTAAKRTLAMALALGAVLTVPSFADAKGAHPASATADQKGKAQSLFVQAKAQFDAKKFEQALAGFRQSYETVASPNSHLYVARCLAALGRDVEAWRELGDTATEAADAAALDKKYADTQTAAEAEQREVAAKLGVVSVRVDAPDARVTVGGVEVPKASWAAWAVAPGAVEVVATVPGKPEDKRSFTIAAGEHKDVAIELAAPAHVAAVAGPASAGGDAGPKAPATDKRKTMRTVAYVAGGVGVAGLVTFAVAGSMAKSQYDDLKAQCGGPCPASRQSDIDSGKSKQTIANVGLVLGIVGLGTGATLFVLSRPKSEAPAASAPAFTAQVAAGPSWIGVTGAFQ